MASQRADSEESAEAEAAELDAEGHHAADVTTALRFMVANGRLFLHGVQPKTDLLGFYDPRLAIEAERQGSRQPHGDGPLVLTVEYEWHGQLYSIHSANHRPLLLPAPERSRLLGAARTLSTGL